MLVYFYLLKIFYFMLKLIKVIKNELFCYFNLISVINDILLILNVYKVFDV